MQEGGGCRKALAPKVTGLSLFGRAVPIFPTDAKAVFDLAAAQNGGVALSCSDEHFGVISNLLLPGRGKDTGDGWETKRTRGEHVDWAMVKLGAKGTIERVVVDTAHFRGNFPQKARTGPDAVHEFVAMKLVMIPDGGDKRLQVWGARATN
ncbi:hypothetical protein GMDG_05188 [Pseudogymnoascus destructans 20631-21]|uniref:Allantoicase domain-containing protein n=1 Tax=Pseudogymnoascus destructans (strain ATCC MYA-4855 / 20631-21) TaxID=658429 RepID=L8FQQ7_PSED2|nr:hypothetical protein GMDG_05188 [Pseudogymnoascus destructans 20631-21]